MKSQRGFHEWIALDDFRGSHVPGSCRLLWGRSASTWSRPTAPIGASARRKVPGQDRVKLRNSSANVSHIQKHTHRQSRITISLYLGDSHEQSEHSKMNEQAFRLTPHFFPWAQAIPVFELCKFLAAWIQTALPSLWMKQLMQLHLIWSQMSLMCSRCRS